MANSSWHELPVFVYGTLKYGQPNSHILQTAVSSSRAESLGQATTVDCWPLIVYSTFNVPFLLDCKGTGNVRILFWFLLTVDQFPIFLYASE